VEVLEASQYIRKIMIIEKHFTSLAYAALIALANINHRSEMQASLQFNSGNRTISAAHSRARSKSKRINHSGELQSPSGPLRKFFPQLPVFDRMKNFCLISLRAAAESWHSKITAGAILQRS
jgi:hypothetical protein